MMLLLRSFAVAQVVLTTLASTLALAQSEEDASSPKIQLGSSRIGGPGLTDRERRVVKSWDEPDEFITEENLPKPGSRKRLPSLHILASRYYGGQQWKEACRFYDMIVEESGEEGLDAKEDARKHAGRAFFGCAESAFTDRHYDQVEQLLLKAEKYGFSGTKNQYLRRRVQKDQYRSKLSAGDLVAAKKGYDAYQRAAQTDEDERIWFGGELAKLAEAAQADQDEISYREIMDLLGEVAPRNSTYRKLRDEETANENIVKNVALVLGTSIAVLGLLSLLSRWRARARVGAAGRRSKNPFLDDEDDL